MSYAVCPSCGENIQIEDRIHERQNIICTKCQELLAVVSLDPLILELYTFANTTNWSNTDKLEAAKRHERKSKHRHGEDDDLDDDWRKPVRKSKIRNQLDW